MASIELAWHYTTGEKFLKILEGGYLLPADSYLTPGERPILWFSRNQFWEETANKRWQNRDGTSIGLTMLETHQLGNGLVRFGVLPSRLIEWPKLASKARMPVNLARALETSAAELGGNPAEWLGSLKKIRVKDCQVHVMNKDCSAWVPVQGAGV